MEEITLALHIHSTYSDGTGNYAHIANSALKAGVDAIIITDHNIWVNGLETWHKEGKKRVLVLTGEEVHDPSRVQGGNHMLILNANREMSQYAPNPQHLIDQTRRSDGLAFIAHPCEDALPLIGEQAFQWDNWDIDGYHGIELWNHLSEFKTVTKTWLDALQFAFNPKKLAHAPQPETLKLWDKLLLQGKKVHAVGGVDAHALKIKKSIINLTLYPYTFHFKSIRNHVFLESGFNGSVMDDRRKIFDALKAGHHFVAYDLPASATGFRFTADNRDGQFMMGDTVNAANGVTFQIRLPLKTKCRLIKDGRPLKEWDDREICTHLTTDTGIYRVEVYLDYLGKQRGWIFSNPIFVE